MRHHYVFVADQDLRLNIFDIASTEVVSVVGSASLHAAGKLFIWEEFDVMLAGQRVRRAGAETWGCLQPGAGRASERGENHRPETFRQPPYT